MPESAGSIVSVNIAGTLFPIAGDADADIKYSKYELEGQATSGKTIFKYTIRSQDIEGLVVQSSPEKKANLARVADKKEDVTLSLNLADGTILRNTGRVFYENWTTMENRSSITLIPASAHNPWTPFAP